MPQFNTYPALRARTFDLQDIQRQSLQNQVLQSDLQQAQADQQQQNQLRGVMEGVGAEAGLGPNAQQALAIDPSQLSTLMKIPKAERDRAKERAGTLANMGMMILNSPGIQRPALDARLRQTAEEYGIPSESIPPLGSPDYEPFLKMNIAKAGQVKTLLDQVPDTPSGYQRTEGGLEFTPGGPADPAQAGRLAAAKRGPDGGKKPAMLQVADAYKQAMGRAGKKVSDAQALRWAKSSVNDTPQETWTKIYMANRRDITMDEDQARKIADEITAYVHGESFGADETTPTPAPGGASLSPVGTAEAATPAAPAFTGVISQGRLQTAPRRKPGRGKAIETMTKDQVVALIYGGRELSQNEIDRLDARLEALGVPRP